MRDQTIDLPLEFDELVRDALLHLYDLARLQTHRLIAWMDTDEPRTTAPRGKLVRQVLLDAIASLYPGSGIEASSPAWRAYRLLELRYLEDRPVTDVMKQMALRKTQYHREHQRALHAVSSVLWDRWHVAERWSTTPVGNQVGESASGSDVARREAAALLANQGSQCADPVQVCHEVSQLLEPLGRERGVQIYVVPKDHVPAIEGNRVALRHALLTILTRAVELPGADVVRIELECKDEQVLIWLRGSTDRPILPTDLGVGESRVFVEAMRGRLHCFAASQQPGQWGVSLSFSVKARRTLLVVDNDVDFIRLMQRYLAGYSWDVIGASRRLSELKCR